MTIEPEVLALLVCPIPTCHGALEGRDETLTCLLCGLQYRMNGRWPVLIPEEAQPSQES